MSDKSKPTEKAFVVEVLESSEQQMRMELGEQVRKARLELDLSQADLATLLGRRQAYISELENGKVDPNASTLMALGVVLRKQVSYFFPSNWRYGDHLPDKAEELTHDEAVLVEKLRQLEWGFQHHLALRIINTIADVSQEEEDFRNTLEDNR